MGKCILCASSVVFSLNERAMGRPVERSKIYGENMYSIVDSLNK